jgi:hypothetical protein
MIRRLPTLLVIGRQDRRQIQFAAHNLPHQVGGMLGRYKIVDRGRQQPSLIHVPRSEGLCHPTIESSSICPTEFALFNPDSGSDIVIEAPHGTFKVSAGSSRRWLARGLARFREVCRCGGSAQPPSQTTHTEKAVPTAKTRNPRPIAERDSDRGRRTRVPITRQNPVDLACDGGGDRNLAMVDGRRGCAGRCLFGEDRRRHVGRLQAGDTAVSWIQILVVASRVRRSPGQPSSFAPSVVNPM